MSQKKLNKSQHPHKPDYQLLAPLCNVCNLQIKPSFANTLLNKIYCPACFKNLVTTCNHCSQVRPRSYVNLPTDDYAGCCNDCVNKYYSPCSKCGLYVSKNRINRRTYQGRIYCGGCLYDIVFLCKGCNQFLGKEVRRHCVGCYIEFCLPCYQKDACRKEGIGDAKLTFRDGKQSRLVSKYRFLAVEIEASCLGNNAYKFVKLPKSFGKGRDGSVNNGMEIKTPPCSGSEFIKNIKIATQALKKANYITTQSCGLHLHIDLRDKRTDFKFLAHLLMTLFAVEDILFATQSAERRANGFCEPLRKNYQFFDFYNRGTFDFDYKLYKKDKKEKKLVDDAKLHKESLVGRGAFNFQSVFFRGSLEVRLHQGTLDEIKILRWADLMQRIIKWCEQSYNYKSVLKLLTLNVTQEKLELFNRVFKLSPPLFNYVKSRIKQEKGLGYILPFSVGQLPKKLEKKPLLSNLPKKIVYEQDLEGKSVPVMVF